MTEKYSFSINPITCHAWNKDRTKIAVSPNNNEVHIYQKNGKEWALLNILDQHDLRVTGIDWAPESNRIVTCSADRNAYVWTLGDDDKWKPTLVLLRINRAATCVKWAPKENKFAVGSGDRVISICYFEQENDWWVSKHIKKPMRSTVTTLDWHPNNIMLVAGFADFKVRIFSAYVKEIEEGAPSALKKPLGTLICDFSNSPMRGGWIHCVRFSGDGNKICWVSHDSSVNIVDTSRNNVVCKLRVDCLPFVSCIWINNNTIITAGHSCCPMMYSLDESGQLQFVCKLDNTSNKKDTAGLSAMKKFQSFDRQGRNFENDTVLDTIHQNAIFSLSAYEGYNGNVKKLSSSGADGQLVIWDLQTLDNCMQGLKIA